MLVAPLVWDQRSQGPKILPCCRATFVNQELNSLPTLLSIPTGQVSGLPSSQAPMRAACVFVVSQGVDKRGCLSPTGSRCMEEAEVGGIHHIKHRHYTCQISTKLPRSEVRRICAARMIGVAAVFSRKVSPHWCLPSLVAHCTSSTWADADECEGLGAI